jgi:hypothetical protein
MRRYLSAFAPAMFLAVPLMAEEVMPPPPSPAPHKAEAPNAVPPAAMPPGAMPGPRPEMMKEIREIEGQMRALKEKADQDPEVIKLKSAVDEAQKAYRAKAEEVMAKDPSFAGLKARREEARAKLMGPRPEAQRPGEGQRKKDGADVPPMNPPPAPAVPTVPPAPTH